MGALSAAVLYMIVATLSDTDVERYRYRILGIAVSVGLWEFVASHAMKGLAGIVFVLVISVGLITAGLVKWCATPRNQALKVAGVYTGVRVGLGVAAAVVFRAG